MKICSVIFLFLPYLYNPMVNKLFFP